MLRLIAGAPVALAAAALFAVPALPDALAAGWRGHRVCQLLQDDGTHRLLRCTFPPGSGHERHYHSPHIGYALQGGTMQITDTKGTRIQVLKSGTSFSSPGTPWHEVRNVGKTTVVYLIHEQRDARNEVAASPQ